MLEMINGEWNEMRTTLEASGLTQPEIALAAGVSQPAVSRLLSSCPKRHGGAFRKLCIYAASRRLHVQGTLPLPIEDVELTSAIREVWNGSAEHARALAAMIRAAGVAARVGLDWGEAHGKHKRSPF